LLAGCVDFSYIVTVIQCGRLKNPGICMNCLNYVLRAFALFLIASCGEGVKNSSLNDSLNPQGMYAQAIESPEDLEDLMGDEYAHYYIVVVDTGKPYYSLRTTMFAIHSAIEIPIDTLGRYFNKDRQRIELPEDDEDELYAGEYYPRRFPSESLSIEYLQMYDRAAPENTMALIAGIFEQTQDAQILIKRLNKAGHAAYSIEARMYTGCMH
jgi:hypothetical protein